MGRQRRRGPPARPRRPFEVAARIVAARRRSGIDARVWRSCNRRNSVARRRNRAGGHSRRCSLAASMAASSSRIQLAQGLRPSRRPGPSSSCIYPPDGLRSARVKHTPSSDTPSSAELIRGRRSAVFVRFQRATGAGTPVTSLTRDRWMLRAPLPHARAAGSVARLGA